MVLQHGTFRIHREMNQSRQLKLEESTVGYFEHYFRSNNFILLVPFKLRRTSANVIILEKNLIHQILCATLLLSTLLSFLPYFFATIQIDLYANPIKLFNVALSSTQVLYTTGFFSVCWMKTDEILNFANLSSSNFLCKRKLFYAILNVYPVVFEVLLFDQLWHYISLTTQENWYICLYEVASLVGFLVSIFLQTFMDTYVAILALSGYNQVRSSVTSLQKLRECKIAENQWKHGDFSFLIDNAEKMQLFFKSLNLIGSPIILTWFCVLVPWVSYKMLDSLPGTGRNLVKESLLSSFKVLDEYVMGQLYYWSYIGLYLVILILCVEIKRECNIVKRTMKKIVLQCDPKLMKGNSALVQIEGLLENVGIHGGFFFTISYSFLARENWYMYIYDGALGIGIFMSIFLTNFMDTYVAILVLSGYNQIRSSVHYLDQLRQRKTTEIQWKIGEFSCLVEISKKLQQYFKSLNLIGSPIILPWFCALVPWVSYKLVISLPGTDIIQKDSLLSSFTKLNQHVIDQVFYWAYFGLYLGILVLSAEIKRECDDLKRVMKEMILQYDPKLFKGKAALVQIEQLLGNVGIHGGYFFNFSYRFLGSAAGLIVAYAFLALQLRLNCCST
ncbi:unnamed protein product [Orchesella dallaii]|uniref:Gustatory receptor n=1 Tax=Orchesella dallaii TaxID=48710 RepID=A0ABP1QGH1_9HEXA